MSFNLDRLGKRPPLPYEPRYRPGFASFRSNALKDLDLVSNHLEQLFGIILGPARKAAVLVEGLAGAHDAHGAGLGFHGQTITERAGSVNRSSPRIKACRQRRLGQFAAVLGILVSLTLTALPLFGV